MAHRLRRRRAARRVAARRARSRSTTSPPARAACSTLDGCEGGPIAVDAAGALLAASCSGGVGVWRLDDGPRVCTVRMGRRLERLQLQPRRPASRADRPRPRGGRARRGRRHRAPHEGPVRVRPAARRDPAAGHDRLGLRVARLGLRGRPRERTLPRSHLHRQRLRRVARRPPRAHRRAATTPCACGRSTSRRNRPWPTGMPIWSTAARSTTTLHSPAPRRGRGRRCCGTRKAAGDC